MSSVTAAKLHLYDIAFDDGTVGAVDKAVWEHSGYTKGSELTDEDWENLCERSEWHRAREKALYYLSLRDYGKRELIMKLTRAGIGSKLAQRVVESLADSGLIDDRRYAAMLARDMSGRKLYPKRRVAMALKEKGFDSEVIEEILEELPEEETQQALELLRKKRYNKLNESASRDKMMAMLARYGFSYGASRRAVEMLEEEMTEE